MSFWSRLAAGAAVLLCAAAGLFALPKLRMDPQSHAPASAVWLEVRDVGADAAFLDERIAVPLEAALAGLPELERIEFHIVGDVLKARLEFPPGAAHRALEPIRARLREARASLPAARGPLHLRVEDPAQPVLTIRLRSSAPDLTALESWVDEQLVQPVRLLPGVATVTRINWPERRIVVRPHMRRLAAVGLTILDVARLLQQLEAAREDGDGASASAPIGPVALAALAVRLPAGDPLPLSAVAQIEELPPAPAARESVLELAVDSLVSADRLALAGRIEAHVSWLHANGLVPPWLMIETSPSRTELWRGPLREALAALVLTIVMVGAVVAWWTGGRGVIRFVLAAMLALLTSAGALVFVRGAPVNVLVVAATVVAVGAAGAFVLGGGKGARMALALSLLFWLALAFVEQPGLRAAREFLLTLSLAGAVALLTTLLHRRALDERAAPAALEGHLRQWLARPPRAPRWVLGACVGAAGFVIVGSSLLPWADVPMGEEETGLHVRLRGADPDSLAGFADEAVERLESIEGLGRITHTLMPLSLRWVVETDADKAAAVGVDGADVGRIVRIALEDVEVATISDGRRRYSVSLSLPEPERQRHDALDRLVVAGEVERRPLVRLQDLGHADRRWQHNDIRRDARGYYVDVMAGINAERPASTVVARARDRLAGMPVEREFLASARHIAVARLYFPAAWLGALGLALILVWSHARRAQVAGLVILGAAAPLPGIVATAAIGGALSAGAATAALVLGGFGAAVAWRMQARANGRPRSGGGASRGVSDGNVAGGFVALAGGAAPLLLLAGTPWLGSFAVAFAAGLVSLCLFFLPAVAALQGLVGPAR